jgi:hypothetical protein
MRTAKTATTAITQRKKASPSQPLNSGAVYRLSPTQQVDFHIGLKHNAPSYIVGVGYCIRFDGLFASTRNKGWGPDQSLLLPQ